MGKLPQALLACLTFRCQQMMERSFLSLPHLPGCLRPLASSNGYLNVSESQSSFPAGTVIAYRCFPGFKLEGAEHLECLHNLIWSSSPPRCLALEGKAFCCSQVVRGLPTRVPKEGREKTWVL